MKLFTVEKVSLTIISLLIIGYLSFIFFAHTQPNENFIYSWQLHILPRMLPAAFVLSLLLACYSFWFRAMPQRLLILIWLILFTTFAQTLSDTSGDYIFYEQQTIYSNNGQSYSLVYRYMDKLRDYYILRSHGTSYEVIDIQDSHPSRETVGKLYNNTTQMKFNTTNTQITIWTDGIQSHDISITSNKIDLKPSS